MWVEVVQLVASELCSNAMHEYINLPSRSEPRTCSCSCWVDTCIIGNFVSTILHTGVNPDANITTLDGSRNRGARKTPVLWPAITCQTGETPLLGGLQNGLYVPCGALDLTIIKGIKRGRQLSPSGGRYFALHSSPAPSQRCWCVSQSSLYATGSRHSWRHAGAWRTATPTYGAAAVSWYCTGQSVVLGFVRTRCLLPSKPTQVEYNLATLQRRLLGTN